jgi:drug/metabolite transporter (DMT)-like permease
VTFGLALALACALATSVSFLLKQRGAVSAPPVSVWHPLRSATGLFRSRWFAVGWLVAVGAWALHVGALALAPLSVVQAVLSAGLVFLAVLAERYFGFHLGRRQWIGVVITAAGLAVIGLTQGSQPAHPPGYALAALITVECSVLLLATGVAAMAGRLRVLQAREGLLLGAAAGALFGVSDIALKFLTDAVQGGALELISPWAVAALAASVALRRRPSDKTHARSSSLSWTGLVGRGPCIFAR